MLARRITMVLRVGASIFLVTSLILVALPDLFLDLLNLGFDIDQAMIWSMRMLGVALIGLSAFMLMAAGNFSERALRQAGLLMMSLSLAFTALTAFAPGPLTLGKVIYLAVGASFALAYSWALRGFRTFK